MGSSARAEDYADRTARATLRFPFEGRIAGLIALLIAPGFLIGGVFIWFKTSTLETKLLLLTAEVLSCWLIAASVHHRIVRPLQTLANVVRALREGDYSFRTRLAVSDDVLGVLSLEINALADFLAQRETSSLEDAALVQRVVEEVEIPIFAFDRGQKLRLVNSYGQKLLQRPAPELLNRTASELGLNTFLTCENETLVSIPFGGRPRWFVRRSAFRQQGVPHTLVVLSDVSRALREEERNAWQRLIRVIGHELNNSLTPIQSIAGSLSARLSATTLDSEQLRDFTRGLDIIGNRAASLNRFLQAYRQLAQMPPPAVRDCSIPALMRRVASLENRVQVKVEPGPDAVIRPDPDQLEQMLINLVRNAADSVIAYRESQGGAGAMANASEEAERPIIISWSLCDNTVVITIVDHGPGLMNPENAFVPFYTTKQNGSGIGLILSRQICEAHGGSLELGNRAGQPGCIAKIVLPRS